jgi:hypothetical protein
LSVPRSLNDCPKHLQGAEDDVETREVDASGLGKKAGLKGRKVMGSVKKQD